MPRHFLYLPFTPAGRSNRATPAKRARQRRQSGGGAPFFPSTPSAYR